MKLLRIDIQDGENRYYDYLKVVDTKQAKEFVAGYCDGFLRAVKNSETMNITDDELKVLEKFGIV